MTDGAVLPDHEINDKLISPFNPECVQPASYDLSLAAELLIPIATLRQDGSPWTADLVKGPQPRGKLRNETYLPQDLFQQRIIPKDGYELAPGACLLASTVETLHIPDDLVARVEGKSSIGRIFLSAHVTAGYVDPGWNGQITLELVNHGPFTLILYAGMRIAQVNFTRLTSPCKRPYGSPGLGSHYQGQHGPVAASGERMDRQ
jgi:dCTP deaminase